MLGVGSTLTINRTSVVGRGGYGVVYAGTYGDSQVVVKTFDWGGRSDQRLLEAFNKEAHMSAKLRHPNIVNFWGTATDPTMGQVLIFERMEMSLQDAIREEPFPATDLRYKWLLGIARAFEYLHQQDPPIIHRDLKPDNVLINPSDKRAILADFGLTTMASSHTTYSKNQGPITGHIFFAPPEAMEKKYKPSITYDVFSFGMTMYYVMTRHWPFEGEELNQTIISIRMQNGIRPDRHGHPNCDHKADLVSEQVWELIQWCWDQSETKRPSFAMIYSNIQGWGCPLESVTTRMSSLAISVNECEMWVDSGVQLFAKEEYLKAVEFFMKAAAQGYAEAQCYFGFCYENGNGVGQDYSEAVLQYQKAAEQDHTRAQFNLGLCYEHGKGVAQDYKIAVVWYQKAADQGYAKAQCNLGFCYENGKGVMQDYSEAVLWYQKAADQGYAAAQCNLGYCYENGEGVVQDYKNAVMWYQKAADQGHIRAQCHLGFCYETGEGVVQDYKYAVVWYQKAADQGHIRAQLKLGFFHENGQGVEQDYKNAVMWYQKAADKGLAEAQFNLGNCYKNGQGVEQDYKNAVMWYQKAADQGYASAQSALIRSKTCCIM